MYTTKLHLRSLFGSFVLSIALCMHRRHFRIARSRGHLFGGAALLIVGFVDTNQLRLLSYYANRNLQRKSLTSRLFRSHNGRRVLLCLCKLATGQLPHNQSEKKIAAQTTTSSMEHEHGYVRNFLISIKLSRQHLLIHMYTKDGWRRFAES